MPYGSLILLGEQLYTALNDLQENTSCSVVIILEYCYSGTFIQTLHHTKRLIINSAAENITKVWAQVIPPVAKISSGTGTISFPETQLHHDQGTEYSGDVEGFSYDGNYTVIFYAKNRSNEVSEPVQMIVRAMNIGRNIDFNQDGLVSLEDMIIVLQSLCGMNASEGIGLADAVHLMQYLGE
jgi:hypothetical protein